MAEGIGKTKISRNRVMKLAGDLADLAQGESKPVRLPSERALEKKFGMSRRAIRLAVDLLVKRNLVDRRHGSGNFLLPKKFAMNTVYLIMPHAVKEDDPFYGSLLGCMMLYARQNRITLVPQRLEDEVLWNKDWPGILPVKLPAEQVHSIASQLRTLIALADLESDECCQVVFDDFSIGRDAARKLWEFGHRQVVILAGPEAYVSPRLRKEGFITEADKLGLQVRVREGKLDWRGGFDLVREYLADLRGEPRATAVFASNDWMAAGAMHALVQAGLRVGQDVSVIGCDDVPLASQLEPGLATFKIDIPLFVEQAFLTLEQSWRLQLPKKIVLPAAFVMRGSLGAAHCE